MSKLPLVLTGIGGFAAACLVAIVAGTARHSHQVGLEVASLRAELLLLNGTVRSVSAGPGEGQGRPNVQTTFNADVNLPLADPASFIDPMASVLGDVILGKEIYVAPFASIRGDEGQPISIGDESNVQDGVVIHALETVDHGTPVPNRTYEVNGKQYAVYIGRRVSLAHQSQVHGPARVDDGSFIGMQALVFKSWIGAGSVVEPGAKVVGVKVAAGRYVPTGAVVTDQAAADKLPEITADYPFRTLNDAVVHVNTSFAEGYGTAARTVPGDSTASPAVKAEHASAEHR
jgi:carbonic anhydrase/acetyltransferase-like protein (isoleucine patch superfamily)